MKYVNNVKKNKTQTVKKGILEFGKDIRELKDSDISIRKDKKIKISKELEDLSTKLSMLLPRPRKLSHHQLTYLLQTWINLIRNKLLRKNCLQKILGMIG